MTAIPIVPSRSTKSPSYSPPCTFDSGSSTRRLSDLTLRRQRAHMGLLVNTMRTETNRTTSVREDIEALRHMTVGQLKDKYRNVFGESESGLPRIS